MIKKSIEIALSLGVAQLLLHSTVLNAGDCCAPDPCCVVGGGNPLDSKCIAAGYPLPAIIKPSCTCMDIYVKGDFLYLGQIENEQQLFAQRMSADGRVIKDFEERGHYRPGFRVGAGIEVNTWVVDFTYLQHHHHSHNPVRAQPNQFVESTTNRLTGPPLLYSSVNFDVDLNVDLGVLSLRQPVYLGKRILMNLGFGLLGVWTDHKKNLAGTAAVGPLPPTAVTATGGTRANHKSWALGPCLTFEAAALFPCGFKMFGNFIVCAEYASLYKGLTVHSHPALLPLTPIIPPLIQYNTSIPSKKNVPHLSASDLAEIGLGWGSYLWCDRLYIDLSVTYAFFYQGIVNFAVPVNAHAVDLTNLISYGFHGISVGGRIDF